MADERPARTDDLPDADAGGEGDSAGRGPTGGGRQNVPGAFIGAGLAIGVGCGVALGVALDNLALGISLGAAFGLLFGIAGGRQRR